MEEATAARERAESDLQQTLDLGREARAIAETLRHQRRVNHFAELFGQSLRGQR